MTRLTNHCLNGISLHSVGFDIPESVTGRVGNLVSIFFS